MTKDVRRKFLESIAGYDFKELASDVQVFLFNPADARKVELFQEFITQTPLK